MNMNVDSKSYKKVAVAIIKNPQGKFLIVKRKNKKEGVDGSVLEWSFPGTAYKDSITAELAKFVENETGHTIKPVKKISQRIYHPLGYDMSYYESELVATKPKAEKPDKITEYKWVDKSDFKKYFTTNIDTGLRKYLKI